MRKLARKELALAKKRKLRRHYLSCLSQKDAQEFYEKFDAFWDQVISPFPRDHFFWRNAVSSKMQEWERSLSYFALILFTLSKEARRDEDLHLVLICASLQEEDILKAWAKKYGWFVAWHKPYHSRWLRVFIQEAENNLRFIRLSAVCFYRKLMASRTTVNVPNDGRRPNILIASLFYKKSFQDKKYKDPFFGAFHEYLEKNKIRCLYLCDSLDRPDFELKRSMSRCHSQELIVPYSLLSVSKLIAILSRVFLRKLRFAQCKFMDIDFSGVVRWNARRFSDYWNISTEVFFEATKKLCKEVTFDQFLYIYEGNVFERACVQAFRQSSSGDVLGYSHGTIDRLNLKLRLTANEFLTKPVPDRYICSGFYTGKRLAEIGGIDRSKISAGCSLRAIPAIRYPQVPPGHQKQILVSLDGMWSSVAMLDWLFEHAEVLQGFYVRIRAHPNVVFDKLKEQCLYSMPEYFEASSGDLKEDLERSFCVIYRQSSIGIQALMNDIPVIHLAIDLPLSGDPIEELTVGKWVAQTPHELKTVLDAIKSLDRESLGVLLKEAGSFAEKYFLNPAEERLQDFLCIKKRNNHFLAGDLDGRTN